MGLIAKCLASARKALCYLIFAVGGLILGLIVLPIERAFIRPQERFRRAGRMTITRSHKFFLFIMRSLGLIRLEGALPDVSALEGKIAAPNHPSLIDVVFLFAIIEGANCIVNGRLLKGPLRFIIQQLYIVNSEDFDKLIEDCALSLKSGETLILFPEGTRTKKGGEIDVKRGIAVISLGARAPIVPFFITGNDKKGLRKKDPIWMINDEGRYTYRIERSGRELRPEDYATGHFRDDTIREMKDLEAILRQGAGGSNV